MKPIIGILLGDAAGVGSEIVAGLISEKFFDDLCVPVIIGDERVLKKGFDIIKKEPSYNLINNIDELDKEKINLLDMKDLNPDDIKMGEVNKICGSASLNMIKKACSLCKNKKIKGFCYAPFNKSSLIEAGSTFESEIHFIANEFGDKDNFGEINFLDGLMSCRVTSHIPLKDISKELTTEKVLNSIKFIDDTQKKLGVSPKIGVAALNPHAGENGNCGSEELEIIAPAVEAAQKNGINAKGPFAADTLFVRAFDKEFNSVVTIYHDQGQIAFKLKGFEFGVTIGGGLSYPVATCAHGTAFDIAGKNLVSTESFKNAVRIVCSYINE